MTCSNLEKLNEKLLHNTVNSINEAYLFGCEMINKGPEFSDLADKAFDLYEQFIENGAKLHKMNYNDLEDLATMCRMYGWDAC